MRKIVWLTGLLTLAACAPPDPLTPEPDVVEPSLDGADDGSGGDVAPEDRTSTPVDGTRRDDIADVGPARIDAPPDVAAPDAPPDVAAPDAAPSDFAQQIEMFLGAWIPIKCRGAEIAAAGKVIL